MNKRVMKIVEKLQTGNKRMIRVRRDQAIKAIQEGAFDYMTGHDHDEMSSWQLKQINNPTIADIESYFLEDTKVYATIENNILEVKFVTSWYSSRSLYINLNKEVEPQQENTIEVIETAQPVAEVKTAKEIKQDIKAEFKNLYNGMFTPQERRFILNTFENIHNIKFKNVTDFYNNHFAAYSEFVKHAIEVYDKYGTLTTELLTNPLPVEEVAATTQQTNIINLSSYRNNSRGENMKINISNLKLKVGNKYTVVKPNELLPECLQFTLINYFIADYAQHKDQLFLIVRYKGHRSNSRLIIAHETAFLFSGWNFSKNWNREKISDNTSLLHRITLNDVKDHKDFIYNIEMGDSFTTKSDIMQFVDYTTDFLIDAGIKGVEQLRHEGYYNHVKQLMREKSYNMHEVIRQCKAWDYIYLVDILDKIQKDYN